jgi:hypothetical protein
MLFGQWAGKYFEQGYSVIPLKGKKAFLNGWQRFCDELPDARTFETWIANCADDNIGLCLGRASGLIALDVDHPDLLKLFPTSPVVRQGREGREVRFFRFNPAIPSQGRRSGVDVELLSTGRQCVLPPSIHPETDKPYIWLMGDLLSINPAHDLPEFPLQEYLNARAKLVKKTEKKKPAVKISSPGEIVTGRNDFLKSHAWAMIGDGVPEKEIVERLNALDLEMHPANPLFQDEILACDFVANLIRSYEGMGEVYTPSNNYELIEGPIVFSNIAESFEPEVSMPELAGVVPYQGIMRDIFEHVVDMGLDRPNPSIALATAIATVSALAGRRFAFKFTEDKQAWPNTYSLILAPSGSGKSDAFSFWKRVIAGANLKGEYTGAYEYGSWVALFQDLEKSPSRLDLLDEASTLFRSVKASANRTVDLKIGEMVMKFFNESSDFMSPPASKKNLAEGLDGRYYNPCISILAATTHKSFEGIVDESVIDGGFLPRWLIFSQEHAYKSGRRHYIDQDEPVRRLERIKSWARGIDQLKVFSNDTDAGFYEARHSEGKVKLSPALPRYLIITDNVAKKLHDMYEYCEDERTSYT